MIEKPPSVRNNVFKSQKWDEITKSGKFDVKDVAPLELLCHWYAVISDCLETTTKPDRVKTTSRSKSGDIRPDPRLSIIKSAYTEIRALNKQLGINDEVVQEPPKAQITTLEIIQGRRRERSITRGDVKRAV